MKKISIILILSIIIFNVASYAQNSSLKLLYQHPNPGSQQVNPNTTLIYRFSKALTTEQADAFKIEVNSAGKLIPVSYTLTEGGRTIIAKPAAAFTPGETVSVKLLSDFGSLTKNDYSFKVTANTWTPLLQKALSDEFYSDDPKQTYNLRVQDTEESPTVLNGVSVPSDMPLFVPSINSETAPGYLFVANYSGSPYIFILENDGTPQFYQRVEDPTIDFKYQAGYLTRHVEGINSFITMDTNYQVVDTIKCGNGYSIDHHDMQLLENEHALVIASESKTIDMSELVANGNSRATAIGKHIQEIDENGDVVFEFNCWDNFDILSAIDVDFTRTSIDFIHTNSIAVDADNNLVISSRNISECTKINRQTGEIMWRLGGKNNQFQFINEEDTIDYQHDIRPVPGVPGNYTIFDNGNHRGYSRVVEYQLDTVNMTATKVWEFRHDPDILTTAMGSAQRLTNGNTLINWASASVPKATEVTPGGEVVYEGNFVDNYNGYRSFRFEWKGYPTKPYLIIEEIEENVRLIFNLFGADSVIEYNIYRGTSEDNLELLTTVSNTWVDLSDLENNQRYYFQVTAVSTGGIESEPSNLESIRIIRPELGVNLIQNGDFSEDQDFWNFYLFGATAEATVNDQEELVFNITDGGSMEVGVQIRQNDIPLISGESYLFEFDAWAEAPRSIVTKVGMDVNPYTNYSGIGATNITSTKTHYSYNFKMTSPTDNNSRVVFNCGMDTNNVYIDNVSLEIVEAQSQNVLNSQEVLDTKIYPNPTSDKIFIDLGTKISRNLSISVYSADGRKVMSENVSGIAGEKNIISLNLEKLDQGTYFCKIEYFDEAMHRQTLVQRIIKGINR